MNKREHKEVTSGFVSLIWSKLSESAIGFLWSLLADLSGEILISTLLEVFRERALYAESVYIVSMTEPKKFVTGT